MLPVSLTRLHSLSLGAIMASCAADEPPVPSTAQVSSAQPSLAPFAIENGSSHALAEIQISAIAEQHWEPLLPDVPLPPGVRVEAERPPCGRYDVLFVKEDGARCVLVNLALCFQGAPWTIHDVTLESCSWRP